MGVKVVEGLWEDVSPKVSLAGRRVRIVYQDGGDTVITLAETSAHRSPSASDTAPERWLKQLVEFSNSRKPPWGDVDLNRDRLFEELHGDRG